MNPNEIFKIGIMCERRPFLQNPETICKHPLWKWFLSLERHFEN